MRAQSFGMVLAATLMLATVTPTATAAELAPSWVTIESPGEFDLAQGIALAPDGSVVVTGTTESATGRDAVTVKFSPTGEKVWSRVIDTGRDDRSEGVVVDKNGNVFVAGSVKTAGGDDAMIHRYDSSGSLAWSLRFDKGTSESARDLALGPDGTIVLVGVSLSPNGADGFVAKFTPSGKELWARAINLYFVDEAFAVAVGPDGSAYVAGRVLREGAYDALLRKYDANGDVAWTKFVAHSDVAEARGVAVDGSGVSCMTGSKARGENASRQLDVLVSCYDTKGDPTWSKSIDVGGGDDEGRASAFDASGNLLITGFTRIDGAKRPFLLKLDDEGNEVWRYIGDAGGGIAGVGAIAVSPDGSRIVAAGAVQRTGADFDWLVASWEQGAPAASFKVTKSSVKAAEPVRFEDASSQSLVPLKTWHWDFGDGKTSTEPSPTHAYEKGGNYEVRLTVRDAYNNRATHGMTMQVQGAETPGSGVGGPLVGDPSESTPGAAGAAGSASFAIGALIVLGLATIALGVAGFLRRE